MMYIFLIKLQSMSSFCWKCRSSWENIYENYCLRISTLSLCEELVF